MYIICMYIYVYMYIIYIYIYFFLVPVVVLRAVWWLVQGLVMFWITFHVKFPPLVLDLFLAFKLMMLSPSSRAASCHFWVLYPLRLWRHTSHAFWLDVFWLPSQQTPWGVLGWFLNVSSSSYQTSYVLGLFSKRSFRRQIDNLSRWIFWVFRVMLFIHVNKKHLFCERIKGLQKSLKITESSFSDVLPMSRGKTALCTITHTHTHTHVQRVCVFVYLSVCVSVFVCVVNVRIVKSTTFVWLSCFHFILKFSVDSPTKIPAFFFFGQRHGPYSSAHRIWVLPKTVRPSMSAVFSLDQVLTCTESATSEYSTTSQCFSTLLGRPGRVKFILDGLRWGKNNQRTYHSYTTTALRLSTLRCN